MTKHFLDEIFESDQTPNLSQARAALVKLRDQIKQGDGKPIVGQDHIIEHLLICLLMDEHAVLEGLPGLAKTLTSKRLATYLGLDFQRAQFIPDMMPSDLIHRQVIKPIETSEETSNGEKKLTIEDEYGKVFTNILLADEINRAPPKVQAALLEACESREVSILTKKETLKIRPEQEQEHLADAVADWEAKLIKKYFPDETEELRHNLQNFMVVATMNPLEQEGVYPLSEAQLDRFAFRLILNSPQQADYKEISSHAFLANLKTSTKNKNRSNSVQRHWHTLYFLAWLRTQVFGPSAQQKWEQPSSIRENVEMLCNFTHMEKWRNSCASDDSVQTKHYVNKEKQAELQRLAKQWKDKDRNNNKLQWGKSIFSLQQKSDFPNVETGISPRGIQKLIKGIHALAFWRDEEPSWDHVRTIAPLVINHRIKISPNRYGKTDPTELLNSLLDSFAPSQAKLIESNEES